MTSCDPATSGPWVTADLVAGRTLGLSELKTRNGAIYWIEARPSEGRNVLVRAAGDGFAIADVTDARIDVGTRVNEYGGGAYALGDDCVFCADRGSGAVWRIDAKGLREFAGLEGVRFADFAPSADGRACIAVREDWREGGHAPISALVWLDGQARAGTVLDLGPDFHASPRLSPDGTHLAWLSWNHPDMPWQATMLHVARLGRTADGDMSLEDRQSFGVEERQSIANPVWLPDGTLMAATDRAGFWNPAAFWHPDKGSLAHWPEFPAETALPHWVFGQESMTPLWLGDRGALVCLAIARGVGTVKLVTAQCVEDMALGAPLMAPSLVHDAGDVADCLFAWIDAPADRPSAVVIGQPDAPPRVLRRSTELPEGLAAGAIAIPEALVAPTPNGVVHAFYYSPARGDSEPPPMIVMAHGGPTGRASPAFSFKVQWWTARGFAVLDVNYRGSTGFGRDYARALDGQWGVLDVDDVLAATRFAVESGRAKTGACFIRGSSAGGMTVLCALARGDVFAAGTSLYGVTDLRALAQETHKFEAHYLDGLIGPYPAAEALYLERSPITQAARIKAPVLFLYGDADRVVPPSQAEGMVRALRAQGLRIEHHVYPGEGHGFRKGETLRDAWEREYAFYRSVLGGDA